MTSSHADHLIPHGFCLLWEPLLIWIHVISDLTIAVAYFSISGSMLVIMMRRKFQVPMPWLLSLFALFIFLCGTTHLGALITLWKPIYMIEGVLKALTAAISIGTAFLMLPLIPRALFIFEEMRDESKNKVKNDKK